MILIFLFVLIVALIIANILVSFSMERKAKSNEKGFANPPLEYVEEPEVVSASVANLQENNALLQGSLQATNKKLELLNERVANIEKIVMSMIQKRLDDETNDETTNQL